MVNNVFYKALAALSTVGILAAAGSVVQIALKKGNTAEDQLAKTMLLLKNARKDALAEVKAVRAEVLKELNSVRSNSLNEIKTDRVNALREVKAARSEALKDIGRSSKGNAAGKVWLIIKGGGWSYANTAGLEKIEMRDMDQCELMGAQWVASPRAFPGRYNFEKMTYVCIEG